MKSSETLVVKTMKGYEYLNPPLLDEDDNDIDREDRAYSEYDKRYPIRRFQFDYDEHVVLASVLPAAQKDGNTLTKTNASRASNNYNFADIALGEGQTPTSVLKQGQWDITHSGHS